MTPLSPGTLPLISGFLPGLPPFGLIQRQRLSVGGAPTGRTSADTATMHGRFKQIVNRMPGVREPPRMPMLFGGNRAALAIRKHRSSLIVGDVRQMSACGARSDTDGLPTLPRPDADIWPGDADGMPTCRHAGSAGLCAASVTPIFLD